MKPHAKAQHVNHIAALLSSGPAPDLKGKLELFGQFVGSWTIQARWFGLNGRVTSKAKGEVHFGWVLDGHGVQDVGIAVRERPARKIAADSASRFYDPKLDAWRCTWLSPIQGGVRTFVARKKAKEIVLEETAREHGSERWIFSDIRPNSFSWRAEER